nr:YcxB family protein [Pontibacter silvestris]
MAVNRLRRYWWLYLLSLTFSLLLLERFGEDPVATIYVCIALAYLVGIFIYLYFIANSSKNKNLFIPRRLIVYSEKIVSQSEDNVHNELPLSYIINAIERKSYWLLYIARSQFIYIPKKAFVSPEDMAAFRKLIPRRK